MKLYISEGALLLLALFYLPLVVWVLLKVWRNLPPSPPTRIGAVTGAFLVAAAIPLWDVAGTSVEMARLCPQAGLFIKRSVSVDGFYTNFGSPDMLERGFKYIESRSYGDRLVVYSKEGGTVKKEELDVKTHQMKSRYEFIYGAEQGEYKGRRDIGVLRSVVRDRMTGEELGYALAYKAYPGWFDQRTLGLLGRFVWGCGKEQADQNVTLMRNVLLAQK